MYNIGFQEKERLAKFFSHYYDMDMLDRELSVKGWNWGSANFDGAVMSFQVRLLLTPFASPPPWSSIFSDYSIPCPPPC
jgi:hypothetical protein